MMKIVFDIYIFLLKFKSLKKTIFLFIFLLSNILISQSEKKELFVKYTDNEIIVDVSALSYTLRIPAPSSVKLSQSVTVEFYPGL